MIGPHFWDVAEASLFGWYDNERGYSNSLADLVKPVGTPSHALATAVCEGASWQCGRSTISTYTGDGLGELPAAEIGTLGLG